MKLLIIKLKPSIEGFFLHQLYLDRFPQTPAITIKPKVIIKIKAAGSGENGIGNPSETVYPMNSIQFSESGVSSIPFD